MSFYNNDIYNLMIFNRFTQFIVIFLISFLSFYGASAQEGSIRGHVYDSKSGEAVSYANVLIEGTSHGTTTNIEGFFTLTGVPVGDYNLLASFVGYKDLVIPVTFGKNNINYYKINFEEAGVSLGSIDITATRTQARTEVRVSKIQVSKKQIKALPSTGGDPDIIQYLQVLPGIISTGDQGGQLFIRGGSPVQNKILLDGLTIYNPFHSIGFYSTFETELIRNVDVLTGGFNAEHGGRISAVVDISTREGSSKRIGGQVSVSPFNVKGTIEGPIAKLKDDQGSLSFVLTSKKSIIEQSSKSLYSYAGVNDTIGLPFGFSDTFGKLSFVTASGSKFNIFGFNFNDEFNNPLVSRIDWNNKGGGLTFDLLPNASSLTLGGIIGFSSYGIGIEEAEADPRSSFIREYLLGLNFNYFGNDYAIKYGIEVKSIRTEFEFTNPFGIGLDQTQSTTELSGFLTFRKSWDNFVIEPGVRLQYYASLGEFSPEPRLGIKWNATESTRFKAAAGLYSQNLISVNNERDVVNLFSGFISGPESQFFDTDGTVVDSKLQRSRHLVAGVEHDVNRNLTLNLEGYIKDFPQIIVVNRNKTEITQSDFTTETGEAYGVDFSAKYENSKVYLWATYSLGFVNRFDGEQDFPTIFDRRHNVNLLATYTTGSNKDWLFSARWNLGSGFPFTKTQGFFNDIPLSDGIGTDYVSDNQDDVGIIFSDERNGGRLPYYHRLDLSVQKNFEFTEHIDMEIVFGVSNTYNRDNIFFFDRVRFERVDQLPTIPSLAARLNF
ncbi:TonB-dependent receptor [Saprospiraceae bacterium]|nr:TonB-dependent receptor [Saprospiraceae bacterium]